MVDKKTGKETFVMQGASTGKTLHDFWSWAYSDIINNTERGKLAEFIVASALDVTDKISPTWDSFDLEFMGMGIEVKSAAYLQSWYQEKDSYIAFGMPRSTAWDATTGKYAKEQKRQADVYVFCLLAHKDKQTLNPLDLEQWEFYIVATSILNALAPTLKKVSLSFLKKNDIAPCSYNEIRSQVERAIASHGEGER